MRKGGKWFPGIDIMADFICQSGPFLKIAFENGDN
jgi:hypothetical protein